MKLETGDPQFIWQLGWLSATSRQRQWPDRNELPRDGRGQPVERRSIDQGCMEELRAGPGSRQCARLGCTSD